MADNVTLNTMTGGDSVGADDILGIKYQRMKLVIGADGVNDGDVASTNPLPVTGTVTANLSATDNAVLDAIEVDTTSIDGKITACNTGAVTLSGGTVTTITNVVHVDDNASSITTDIVDGGSVTLGAKADARSTATDATAVTVMQVLKEISYMEQTPASRAVTNAGTFPVQATLGTETTKVIGTVNVASGQSIGVTSGTATNCKVEAAIAASQTLGTVTTLTNWEGVLADDGSFTVGSSKVRPVGLLADETSTDSVDEGDVGIPRMTLDRKAIVTDYPSATGEGLDIFRSIDVDETEEDIKASAGKIFGWYLHNAHTATLFVKFYNATAADTTVGTTTPLMTIPLPAGASANVEFGKGLKFSTALCIACTTGVADDDTGAPAANMLIANIFYK